MRAPGACYSQEAPAVLREEAQDVETASLKLFEHFASAFTAAAAPYESV